MDFIWSNVTQCDLRVLLWIQDNLRQDVLTPVFRFITNLGGAMNVWVLITAGLLIFKKTRRIGVICLISMLLTLVINNLLLKNLVARPRPFNVCETLIILIKRPTDLSFPSGHTAISFACAGVLVRHFDRKYGVTAILLAALIAFSRLYFGVHYPTDVITGCLIGLLMSYVAEKGLIWWEKRKETASKQSLKQDA